MALRSFGFFFWGVLSVAFLGCGGGSSSDSPTQSGGGNTTNGGAANAGSAGKMSGGGNPASGGASNGGSANGGSTSSAGASNGGTSGGIATGGNAGSAGRGGSGGSGGSAPTFRYTTLVNPLIGTAGPSKSINCFPGAVLPWGMVAASPDTTVSSGPPPSGGNHASGYLSEDDLIQGFSHTRLQGTSTPDIGVVMLMPAVGDVSAVISESGYRSTYDKASETASPGYYSVKLTKPNVLAEMTATRRGAFHRYTFQTAPAGGQGRVVLDLGHAMLSTTILGAQLTASNNGATLEGYTTPSGRFSGPSKGGLKTYFSIQFDPAPAQISTFNGTTVGTATTQSGTKIGAVLSFDAKSGTVVQARVGISYVDVDGARKNRQAELATLDFDATKQAASDAWEKELDAVRFTGGTNDQRTIMATALYHSFVVPSLVTDVDGRYHGFDNATHTADFDYHTNFSMWDSYRTVHPLLDLVRSAQESNLARSLIQMAREGGYFPRWPMGHGYPNITAGSPADIVVGDAYLRGVTGFDASEALDLMLKEIDSPPPAGSPHSGREGLADYLSKGYVPFETVVPGVGKRVVVRTLEYNIADATIMRVATAIGRTSDATRASKWQKSYTTLWDPSTVVFRGKHEDGSWVTPFDAFNASEDLYYGANATQYSWLIPHDSAGLMALHGSAQALSDHLTTFFEGAAADFTAGRSTKYYTHVNEPDVHAMYLFLQAGRPDLAQKWVAWASSSFYTTARDGIAGNEDAGTLSAWYVLSSLGLYAIPSTDVWLIGRPAFPSVTLSVSGGTFVIDAPAADATHIYIKAATLNGVALTHPWVHQADIAKGGTLHFDMTDQPADWGKDYGAP